MASVRRALAERHDAVIHRAAGLPLPGAALREAIRTVDLWALATERRDFLRAVPAAVRRPWAIDALGIVPGPKVWRPLPAAEVEMRLMACFNTHLPALMPGLPPDADRPPMPRCPVEERDVLAAFAEWCQTRPDASLIVGFVEAGDCPGAFDAQIGDVGCRPAELLVLANAILMAAAEDAACERDANARRALLTRIEGARACLGFHSGPLAS